MMMMSSTMMRLMTMLLMTLVPPLSSSDCGQHSYACAGTPRCVLSSQVDSNMVENVSSTLKLFYSEELLFPRILFSEFPVKIFYIEK